MISILVMPRLEMKMDDEKPPKSPFLPRMTQEVVNRSLRPVSAEELMEPIDVICARLFPRGAPEFQGPPRILPLIQFGKGWETDPRIPTVIFIDVPRRKQGERGAR